MRAAVVGALLLGLLLLAAPAPAAGAKKKKPKKAAAAAPELEELPLDAEIAGKGELDALTKIAGSDKMKGKTLSKREISKDGKSGMLTFSDPDAQGQEWKPAFQQDERELQKTIQSYDTVLVYFWSSANDNDLIRSHEQGKLFEAAAQQLEEMEHDASLTLASIDLHKAGPLGTMELGNPKPHSHKLYINGKPRPYAGPASTELLCGLILAIFMN